jgi:hypothetical protein
MSERAPGTLSPAPAWRRVALRRDVLAGLMFVAVAAFGLYLSRHYPIGTATRMGTGYVPRLLCWVLLGLGGVIALQGALRPATHEDEYAWRGVSWRPVVFVTAALMIFGLALERLGLVVSILLMIAIGAFAARGLRLVETVVAAAVLIVLAWAIFILGLGISIPLWPEF